MRRFFVQALNLARTVSPVFALHDLTTRAVNGAKKKKLFVSVSVQLTNVQTRRRELYVGHLANDFAGFLSLVDL